MCLAQPCPRVLHTCSRESMVKDPAVGFMQATYWQLRMSFRVSLFLSYLCRDQHRDTFPRDGDRFPRHAVPLQHSPVPVVQVLPDKRVWCHSAILVHLWHVHVINEVDKPSGARWAKNSP